MINDILFISLAIENRYLSGNTLINTKNKDGRSIDRLRLKTEAVNGETEASSGSI